MHTKNYPRENNHALQDDSKQNQSNNSLGSKLISPTKVAYHKLDKDQPQHRMATGTAKLSIARPLQHPHLSNIHPIGPGLLDEGFHKSQEYRQKNKPNQKHQNLKPPMRQQIEAHNIPSTDDGIKQIGNNIHKHKPSLGTKYHIILQPRHNIQVILVHFPIIPGIDNKSGYCCQCC